MAMATYNTTLEYAENLVEFWLMDEDSGSTTGFADGTRFWISRVDETVDHESFPIETRSNYDGGTNNYVSFKVNPSTAMQGSEDLYDYDNDTYEHAYSVRSDENVYIRGKLNLVKVA